MKQKNNFIEIHTSSLEDYIIFYRDEAARNEAEMSKSEAAAGLLLHTGMLYRYTGNEQLIHNFLQAPEKKRKELALDATVYLLGLDLLSVAEALYTTLLLEDDQFEQAESLFFRRDELAVTIDLIRSLAFEAIKTEDPAFYPSFLELIRQETNLDKLLRSNPALAEQASIPLRALAPLYVPSAIEAHHWWLSSYSSDAVEAEADAFSECITASVTDSLAAAKAMFEKGFSAYAEDHKTLPASATTHSHFTAFAASSGDILHASLAENNDLQLVFTSAEESIQLSVHVADKSDTYDNGNLYCFFRDKDGKHTEVVPIAHTATSFPAEWMRKEGCCFALEDKHGKSDLVVFKEEKDEG